MLIIFAFAAEAEAKKLRFIGTAGGAVQNEILNAKGFAGGGGLHIAYPVSPETKFMNVELAIANWYTAFPGEDDFAHLLRFGFGIRVFLNLIGVVRPYFTHDITSHLVWVKSREGFAPTYGILLGLGLDVPLRKKEDKGVPSSSIFFDVSYNSFELAYFEEEKEPVKFLAFSCGFSWNIPKLKKEKKNTHYDEGNTDTED